MTLSLHFCNCLLDVVFHGDIWTQYVVVRTQKCKDSDYQKPESKLSRFSQDSQFST